jgi:hypothetical protein
LHWPRPFTVNAVRCCLHLRKMGQASPCTHPHAYEIMTANNARGSGVWCEIMLSPFAQTTSSRGVQSSSRTLPLPGLGFLSSAPRGKSRPPTASLREQAGVPSPGAGGCCLVWMGCQNPRGPPPQDQANVDGFLLTGLEDRTKIQRGRISPILSSSSSIRC